MRDMLTIKNSAHADMQDECEYMKAICISKAPLVIVSLKEIGKHSLVKDIKTHIIKESQGNLIFGDQAIRNACEGLTKLGFLDMKIEKWGTKRIKKFFQLTEKGNIAYECLDVFFQEVKKRTKL